MRRGVYKGKIISKIVFIKCKWVDEVILVFELDRRRWKLVMMVMIFIMVNICELCCCDLLLGVGFRDGLRRIG